MKIKNNRLIKVTNHDIINGTFETPNNINKIEKRRKKKMSSDVQQFSNMLMIALVFLIFVLIALTVVYFLMRMKENKPLSNKKNNKNESDAEKKVQSSSKTQTMSKESISKFMEFDKVEDNMIIQKGGKRFVMVVECQGINYDLMSEMEKTAVEEGFIQFLNTLRHPIQIYIQTRTVNLNDSIQKYKASVNEIEMELNKKQIEYNTIKKSNAYSKEQIDNAFYELTKKKNLYEYGKDLVKDTEKISLNKNVLTKKYYIVISYFSEEAMKEDYAKDEIQNMAFSELYTKAQSIIRTLFACSVSGKILNSYELVELLYYSYNREQAEVYGLDKAIKAGYEELYSTAQDVIDKKEKILDKQIQEEAMKLAKETTDRVKSEKEKAYDNKSNSMEKMIQEMAKLIIEENKDYIGPEVAEEAIKDISKQQEGGKEDVQEK